MSRTKRLSTVFLVLLGVAGCASDEPHTRLGGLPCPGLFTLYELADPTDLGTTRYESMPRFFQRDECGHGILYTENAGFLDVAHIRESMDMTRYYSQKVALALRQQHDTLDVHGYDFCPFHLTFRYPPDWNAMAPEEREKCIDDLSIRIGQRVTLNALQWHEIITWFDYGTTLVWSEKASAFTYEDIMSHVIGILAADEALRHPKISWDEDATHALASELEQVRVVSKKEAAHAVELVKDRWWSNGNCIRRMLDVGEVDDCIHPWLVRGMPGGDELPQGFFLPTFYDVNGRDFSDFWTMTIEPSLVIPSQVLKLCTGDHKHIDPAVDFPVIMEKIRSEVRAEFGPTADQPYDLNEKPSTVKLVKESNHKP